MANEPLRRTPQRAVPPASDRPKIWAEGEQRPPFSFRGLRRATLRLSRDAVVPLNAWAARSLRRAAVKVADGAGRIPEGKLGRAERFVPSHLRVAGWIKNTGAVFAHASAVADVDVLRGNALVAEIEPHLWPAEPKAEDVLPDTVPAPPEPEPSPFGADAPPVVLAEPEPPAPEPDVLAAIRDDLTDDTTHARKAGKSRSRAPSQPALPPAPPGQVATTAIQMLGYLVGWATVILALPFGMVRSLWLWLARNVDLRRVGLDD
jgi:hypothetical protein